MSPRALHEQAIFAGSMRRAAHRRGAALAAVVVLLSVVHLATLASVRQGRDESDLAALRVETARAFFAADAGIVAALRTMIDGSEPAIGTVIELGGGGAFEVVDAPVLGEAGILMVEGRSGLGLRRVALSVE